RLMRGERVLDRTRNGSQRPLMENVVGAFAGCLYAGNILKIHLLERDFTADVGEVFQAAGGEIVDAADLMALLDQGVCQSGTNETCNASDQIPRHCLLCSPKR